MPNVKIEALSKRFPETVAVDNMTLHIEEGSLTTFLGPSGCGKTTTLRMIAGLETPTAGSISIGDQVVAGDGAFVPPEQRQIGMVFQSYAIWPHMNVFDNVAYPLQVRRLRKAEVRERAMAALKVVQLSDLAERYPSQLSGGQQQRVAVARAIVFEPQLLLFDEPLSNLDAKLREQMRMELRELQQRLGVTTLYVTHDQQEALAISDVVAVMEFGKLVQVGRPQDIYEQPTNKFVADFVGWTNFLPVTVTSDGADLHGVRLTCPVPEGLSPDTAVELSIRPVDIRIADHGESDDNVLVGDLRGTIYMGKYLICDVAIGGSLVQAYANLNQNLTLGEQVEVRFRPDAARLLAV